MEAKLGFLMREIGYKESSRKLVEKTGVSFTTTFRMAKNENDYTCSLKSLNALATYFNVSLEFLIGKSNNGYYAYYKNERLDLSYDEAIKYKSFIDIKEVNLPNLEYTEDLPKTYIKRTLKVDEMTQKILVSNEVKKKITKMNYFQLKDILDLIDKYILK